MGQFKPIEHVALCVNPRSRRAGRAFRQCTPILREAAVRFELIETPGARDLVERISTMELPFHGVVGIGGDGTFHNLVNGMMRRPPAARIPLGLIPAGTGNALMSDLNCLDPTDAVRHLLQATPRPIDVMAVTSGQRVTWCFNIAGCGLITSINRLAERLRWLGRPRYTVATLCQVVSGQSTTCRVVLDGEEQADDLVLAVAMNTRHTGRQVPLAPRASFDDGLLDVVLVRRGPRRRLLELFARVRRGDHLDDPLVGYHQVTTCEMLADGLPLNLDGELEGATPVSIEVLPGGLDFLWPASD